MRTIGVLALVLWLTPTTLLAQEPPSTPAPAASPVAAPDWLSLRAAARTRVESRSGRGFVEGDDDTSLLTRLRLGVGIEAWRWARFFVEAQDSRAPGLPRASANFSDALDFYQGYVEIGARDGGFRLRVGRQEIQFGQQRLISVNPWRNTGRSFDAVRVMVGRSTLGVDLLASAVVEKRQDQLDGWVRGERLYGAYGRIGSTDVGGRVEPYLFVRTRSVAPGGPPPDDRITVGARAGFHVSSRLELSGETVHQRGDQGDQSIAAWMSYGIVGYTFAAWPWQPRLDLEYSYASGDGDPADGRAEGFDTLYNTPHRFYGYADLIGGRNIQDAHATVTVQPATPVTVAVDVHRLWLATRKDGLYGPSLTPAVAAPVGGFDTADVGTELDVTVTYLLRRRWTIGGGWSHLFRGRLLETRTTAPSSSLFYVTVDTRF